MTARINLTPARPEYRTSTLALAVLLYIGATAAGVCIGVVGAFEADRIIHASEYAE